MQTSYNHNQFGAGLHSSSRFESQNANSRHGSSRGSSALDKNQDRNFDKIFGQVIAGKNEQSNSHSNYDLAHSLQFNEHDNNLATNDYDENDDAVDTHDEHATTLAELSSQQQLFSAVSFGIGGSLSSTMQALDSHNKLNNAAKKQEQKANDATDSINDKLKELNEQKQQKLQELKKDDSLEQVKEKISDNLEKLGLKTDSIQKVLDDPNSTKEELSQALDNLTQEQAKQEEEQGINIDATVEAVKSQDAQLKQQAVETKQATEQESYKKDYSAYLKSTVNLNNGNSDKHAQKIVQIKEQVADAKVKTEADTDTDAEQFTNINKQVNSNTVNNFNTNQVVGTTLASTVSGANNISTTNNISSNIAKSGLQSESGESDIVGGLFSKSVQLEKNVATSNVINLDIIHGSKKNKLDKLAGYEDMEKVTVKSGKAKDSENIARLESSEKNSSDSNSFTKNDGQQGSTFSQVVGAKSHGADKLAESEQQTSQRARFEEHIAKQEDIKKITKYIDSKQTIKSIEIQLHPKDLGKLNIHLTDDNGQLHAKIVAENKDVKNMIEAQFKGIKEILEAKGIKLGSFDLQVKSTDEVGSKFATTKSSFAKNGKQDNEGASNIDKSFTSALDELRNRRLYV